MQDEARSILKELSGLQSLIKRGNFSTSAAVLKNLRTIGGRVFLPLTALGIWASASTGYAGQGRHDEPGYIAAGVEILKDAAMADQAEDYVLKPGISAYVSGFKSLFGLHDGPNLRERQCQEAMRK